MASLLFIAPADLGEAVLATGALSYALEKGDRARVVCGPEAAGLYRAIPNVIGVLPIAHDAGFSAWWRLWAECARTGVDRVIDLRGGAFGKLVKARARVTPQSANVLRHRVEDWTHWLGADQTLAPKIVLDDVARAAAAAAVESAMVLALAPGGVSAPKRWPGERFAAVARRLAGGPLAGAQVVVLGAAQRDAELTAAIASSLEADGVAVIDLGARLDLLGAAALLERATLCVGNDNALAHIAAAMGAPTLTLFGPTDERVRAPYGKRSRTLRRREYEEIMGMTGSEHISMMEDISVDDVEAAALELLSAGGLR